jgi:Type IV secretory pathway, VirB3-like protein
MNELNQGLIADPLFVGATRPPMRWGVTYSALLFNVVFTMEAFLLTKNRSARRSTVYACCSVRGMRAFSTSCCCGRERGCPRCSLTYAFGRRAVIARWSSICRVGGAVGDSRSRSVMRRLAILDTSSVLVYRIHYE